MTQGQQDKIARRYARALFEAIAPQDFDVANEQLTMLSKVWSESADFRECILNPAVGSAPRAEILEAVVACQGGWRSEPVKKTAHLLVGLRKAPVFPTLCEIFAALVREYRKSLALQVSTAHQLSDDEIRSMKERLSAQLGGDVLLTTHHDSSLIGGLTIRMGDRLLDRSVAGTLTRLAEQLSH